jgi:membrane protease YdiL (CAAX protease family)
MEAYDDEDSEFDIEYEEKWHGVPPAGERPPPTRWRYLGILLLVFIVELILWATYRLATKDIYGEGFNIPFFLGHIIAAPLIHLSPILLYWKFMRKEKIFYKDDLENGKFMSFNFGPFKMTRKRLMTAVLVGLFGGIMWRMAEMFIGNFSSVILGGTELFSLHWMDVFSIDKVAGYMDWPTFFLMTFVMFFIVGPVEEFEFRSFFHDQSQRVLPKWSALVFSSVLFGLSHLPIAIFLYMPTYDLEVIDIVFMEISWMAAGATFGALYMWSRNIFACIVMHGIGNWQLSVYMLRGVQIFPGLDHTQSLIADLAVSIFANAFMILVFFLIHKYYWAPQQRGEAALRGKLMKIQQYLFSHDNASKHVGFTSGSLSGATVITLVILLFISLGLGVKDMGVIYPGEAAPSDGGEIDFAQYIDIQEIISDNQNLPEGSNYVYDLNSTRENIIQKIFITLSWADEANPPANRIRTYENLPDTFNMTAVGPNLTAQEEASNAQGSGGTIIIDHTFTDEQIMEIGGLFNLTITVNMVDAGMWIPTIGPGFIGLADRGNDYDITITITRKIIEKDQAEEASPEEEMIFPFI